MTRKTRNRVGVIGLGQIGSKIAAGLRGGGFSVYVWNRSPRAEPNFLGSAVEVADLCDIVQLFVPDAKSLNEVVRTLCAALRPQHVILGHATVPPEVARQMGTIVEAAGARYLDAPIVGTRADAEARKLVYYIGGREDALRDVRTVLQTTARRILHAGGVGDASMLKLATQTLSAVTVQAVAEMHAVGKAGGLSDELLLDALEDDPARSALAAEKLEAMTAGQFQGGPPVRHTLTGLQLALASAAAQNLYLPSAEISAEALRQAVERGQGSNDAAIVARGIGPRPAPAPPAEPAPPAAGAEPKRETKAVATKIATKPIPTLPAPAPGPQAAPASAAPKPAAPAPAPGSAKARLAAATEQLARLFERPAQMDEATGGGESGPKVEKPAVPIAAPAPSPAQPPPLPSVQTGQPAIPEPKEPARGPAQVVTSPPPLPAAGEPAPKAPAPASVAPEDVLPESITPEPAAAEPVALPAAAEVAVSLGESVGETPATAEITDSPEPASPPADAIETDLPVPAGEADAPTRTEAPMPPEAGVGEPTPPAAPAIEVKAEPRPLEIPVVQQSVPAPPVPAMRPLPAIRPVAPLPPFRPFSKRSPAAVEPPPAPAAAPEPAVLEPEPVPEPPPVVPAAPLPPFPVAPPADLPAAAEWAPPAAPEPAPSPVVPRPAAPLLTPAMPEGPRPLVPPPATLVPGLGEIPARPLTLPPVAPPRPSERIPIIPQPLKPKSPTARIPFPMPPVPRPTAPPPPIVGKTDASGRFRLEARERPPTNRVPISTTTFPAAPPPVPTAEPPPPPSAKLVSEPPAEPTPRAPLPTTPVSSPMFLRRPRGETAPTPVGPPLSERPPTNRVPLPPPPDDEPVNLPPVETPLAWDDSPEPEPSATPAPAEPAPLLERAPFQAFRGTNFIPYVPDEASARPTDPSETAPAPAATPAGEWQIAAEPAEDGAPTVPGTPDWEAGEVTNEAPAGEAGGSAESAPPAEWADAESETELEPDPQPVSGVVTVAEGEAGAEDEPEAVPVPMLVREIVTEVMPPAHVPTGHTRPTPIVVPGEIRPIERVVSGSKVGGGRVSEPPRKRSWIRKLFGV